MKKNLFVTAAFFSLALHGCILDSLETINQNLPISRPINIVNVPVSDVSLPLAFDLNSSDIYQDYKADIKKIEYTSLSFRTTELNMPALEGDLEATIQYGSYTTLYTQKIKPENYKTAPFIFNLPASEIAKINSYLAEGKTAFVINIKLTNVTPDSGLLTLRGYLDAVFNFEAEI